MQRNPRAAWRWIPIPAFCVLSFGLLFGDQAGREQVPTQNVPKPVTAADPTPQFYPYTFCVPCHNQPPTGGIPEKQRATMICRLTEWQYYDKADKHQIAYAELKGERSKNIVKLMGYKDTD